MKEINLNGNVVAMYDDIQEMPITNNNLLNEYSLVDNDIGSTMEDIDKHFHKLDTLLAHKKIDEAIQERKNMHQNFWNILNNIHFPSLQFACCIHSINGERITDYSQDNLNKILRKLDVLAPDLSPSYIREVIEYVKKKFKISWNSIIQRNTKTLESQTTTPK